MEAFLDRNSQYPISLVLPANGSGANLEALGSRNLLRDEERMDSIIHMAELNSNFGSNVMNTTLMESSSISRPALATDAAIAAYLESHGITNMEPYISLPSTPMSFSGSNCVNAFQNDDTFSHLFQDEKQERKSQQPGNVKGPKELCKTKLPTCRALSSVKIKKERDPLTPSPNKQRVDHNQENIPQQQEGVSDIFLWNELQVRNTQLTAMVEKYSFQNLLQKPVLHSAPQFRGLNLQLPKPIVRSTLQDPVNLQTAFVPLLEGGICSRRLKQYLYHLRNNTHDNSIVYWQKFVSEYYAPGAKKRWCFSNYEDIQLQATGVFYPKSMEAGSCDICGSRSGKGLEATFDIFPRLFKTKFECGMLDEILFVDSPRASKFSTWLVLEYGKAIQESVYENFRVVHEGKLRIVFRYDLKILSWVFCAQKHEEFLLRRLITPEVNQMMQACQAYQHDIQSDASLRVSSENLQTLCDTFMSAGNQLVRNLETPLVNDMGYPKRFIRCLQIAEVVDSMKDVITLCLETGMGPIDCFNNISCRSTKTPYPTCDQNLPPFPDQPGSRFPADFCQTSANSNMLGSRSLGGAFVNSSHQLVGQTTSAASMRRMSQDGTGLTEHSYQAVGVAQSSCSPSARNPHQAVVDKLLHEMVSANRVKSVNNKYETVQKPNQIFGKRNGPIHGERPFAPTVQSNSANASRTTVHLSKAISRSIKVKSEPCSPEQLP